MFMSSFDAFNIHVANDRSCVVCIELYAVAAQAIFNALRGQDSGHLRVLDVMLRQHAAKQGCLLVRQSFFHIDPRNSMSIGGGVVGLQGFYSGFRSTQAGLSLNMDVSTTLILKPGKVVDFLLENHNVKNIREIDWMKAKMMLKNLRVKTFPSNFTQKIIGLSEKSCRRQTFFINKKSADSPSDPVEITVSNYYAKYHNQEVFASQDYPCLDVGKPKRPIYIPIELCELISLQRYTKPLSALQRAKLAEQSALKPHDRMTCVVNELKRSNYAVDPLINSTGITINTMCTQVEGRVLEPPKLTVGNGGVMLPRGGYWSFNNKHLEEPHSVIQEDMNSSRNPAPIRAELMFEAMKRTLPGRPRFLLCILPERKNHEPEQFSPLKRKCLVEDGIVTQCMAPMTINDLYLTHLLLKINAKMGGLNSVLSVEHLHSIPLVSRIPMIIFGMDVYHAPPGRSDIPSIAAVVSSRKWPLISRYRASVRAQSSRVEMIDALFKPVSPKKDEGMIRELLVDFYQSTHKLKPKHVIIFRDGVSESMFDQVLNIELEHIMQGTTQPTHYHVLLDQIGFSVDDLQELVHSLSYVYQKSTYAKAVVAPVCYAHQAAAQMSLFGKFDDMSDTTSSLSGDGDGSSGGGGGGSAQLPKLHENVRSSMFFC
ncbi:putative post-transcriptional gene silencing PAZ-Argonaute family [Helianthus anomalus]